MIEVFGGEQRARRQGNVLHAVAIPATHAGMFALQHIACRCVIESLWRRIPMDHLEIHTVVVGVTFDAGSTSWTGSGKRRMKALVLLDLTCDFPVALKTLERWGAG